MNTPRPHLSFDLEQIGHRPLAKLIRDNFSSPLEIKVDADRCIAIANWGSSRSFDVGMLILHGEGAMEVGRNSPTYGEYLGVPPELEPDRDYSAIAELAIDSFGDEHWLEDVESDADHGRRAAALRAWLGERMPIDWEAACDWLLDNGPSDRTPGFELESHMSKSDKEQFGVKIVDLGGPASSVPAVRFLGSIEDLNMLLNKVGLPYVAIGPVKR
ncbi:hypothetical protein [Candidatus Viadribacter manganicus]|uniref:Uncharacterized protein n=1 Tax=Candidatus Viadribacter manganicus TaxID=1759059 RepID=A0A1B1AHP3_9PROT|nr:hypothetical protein [Candidatus Viadribacter manganicus]ANP46075.1 hypothetical protein ATE48_09150 [Candidatus Viadribacter manganicus]